MHKLVLYTSRPIIDVITKVHGYWIGRFIKHDVELANLKVRYDLLLSELQAYLNNVVIHYRCFHANKLLSNPVNYTVYMDFNIQQCCPRVVQALYCKIHES